MGREDVEEGRIFSFCVSFRVCVVMSISASNLELNVDAQTELKKEGEDEDDTKQATRDTKHSKHINTFDEQTNECANEQTRK